MSDIGSCNTTINDTNLIYFQELRAKKNKLIYDLIEEVVEIDLPKKDTKEKIKKNLKYKNAKLFEGRNIIKKVKTHCLKLFYKSIKSCTLNKDKISPNFRLKIHEKKHIYKIFKSDISKYRNKVLLNIPMKTIMKIFSNINIDDNSFLSEEKKIFFNFLMNSTWHEILLYVKRGNKDIARFLSGKSDKILEISNKEVTEYLNYIKNGTNNYKDRVNLDKNYVSLYEKILEEYKLVKDNCKIDLNKVLKRQVQDYLINFSPTNLIL